MEWDYIIVGAGSAGCALAHQLLTSIRNARVLLLEAGGSDRSPLIKIPALVLQADAKYDWGYQAQPDPSRNGVVEQWIRGKVLGGSSSINGTIYVRGAAHDFDRWADHCGHRGGWSAREVMPIFSEMEQSDQPGPLRGHNGPLHVRTVKRPHAITQAYVNSASAAGYSLNEDYNARSQEGVAYAQLTKHWGLRCSAADAFLRSHLGNKRLRLLVNAFVEKVEVIKGRAEAVVFRHQGQERIERARDVILCAGAINSPKLLMLSGIGDAQELRGHQIPVVLDLPAVGQNFKDHPLSYLAYRTKIPTYNPTEGIFQKLRIAAKFVWGGEGPISNIWEGGGFFKSDTAQAYPDIQVFLTPVGYLKMPDGSLKLAPYPAITVVAIHSYPIGSGSIRLASNAPDDPPRIEYSLLANEADIAAIVRGIRTVSRIMAEEPMASLIEAEVTPGAEGGIKDSSALRAFVKVHTTISFHSIGTCRMGSGKDAVVDPELRVHGTENLWVADASIIPEPISANMNAPCMMIGAKLGKQLASR